jgi:hypothetical protein
MAVRDVNSTQQVVYVYNTDVAASGTFALSYCAEYGIPAAQRVGLALGTANVRAYDSESTIYGLIEDIRDACMASSASIVIVGAGCPTALGLLTANYTANGSNDGQAFDFVHLACAAKRIVAQGYMPRTVADGSGGYQLQRKINGAWTSNQAFYTTDLVTRVAEDSGLIELYNDEDYDDAITAAGAGDGEGVVNQIVRYVSGYDGNCSSADVLPGGFAGYYTHEEATHPADLHAKSIAILNRAIASEGRLAALTARKVFCAAYGLSGAQTEAGKTARASLMGKKFDDAGLQLTYITETGADAAAEYLLPESGSHSDWTPANLDAGTAAGPAITADVLCGWGFSNVDPTVAWDDRITPTVNGLFLGGKSGNGKWGKWCQVAGGHSAIIMQIEVGGTHALSGTTLARQTDAVLALLDGRSLAEAAWCGYQGALYAIGDPLLRPFQ